MNKLKNNQRLRKLMKIASRYSGGWWIEFQPDGNGRRHSVRYTRCYLCNRIATLDQMTIDHKVPRWQFRKIKLPGANALCNLGLAHESCNGRKAKSENPQKPHGFKQKKPLLKRIRKFYRRLRYKVLLRLKPLVRLTSTPIFNKVKMFSF